jgi:hypothetical protein
LRRTSPEQIPYECSRHVQYLAEASTSQAYRIGVASYAVRICCPYGQTTVFGTVACTRRDLPILRLVQSMGLPITDIGDTHPMRTSLNGKYCTGLVAYRGSLDPSSSMGRLHHALPPQWDRCYEYHVYVAIGTTTCTAQYRGLKQSSTRGSLKGLGLTSTGVYTPAAFRTSPTRILTAVIGLSPGLTWLDEDGHSRSNRFQQDSIRDQGPSLAAFTPDRQNYYAVLPGLFSVEIPFKGWSDRVQRVPCGGLMGNVAYDERGSSQFTVI